MPAEINRNVWPQTADLKKIALVIAGAGSLGSYEAGFAVPVPGAWNVHLTVRHGGDLYVADERLILR